MLNPECSIPGRLWLECCEDEMKLLQTMADLFAKKATSTVTTRAGSMAMYCAWVLSQHPGEAVLPIREARVYDYACMCRDTAKSASRIDTFVGTLKYVASEFGFEGAEEVSKSPRVLGAAYSMLVRRPLRKRAEALHPVMICWLEIACFALPDPFDRMVAGLCMLCCMGRLRCSDAKRIRYAGLVGRFVEGALSRTETSRSKERATCFIPLVVPGFGLLAKPWFLEFFKSQRRAWTAAYTKP